MMLNAGCSLDFRVILGWQPSCYAVGVGMSLMFFMVLVGLLVVVPIFLDVGVRAEADYPMKTDAVHQLKFKELARTKTLSGSFQQEVYSEDNELVNASQGKFWLDRPDKMRWWYTTPVDIHIWVEEDDVVVYDVSLAQASRMPFTHAAGSTPLVLLLGSEKWEDAFQIRDLGKDDGYVWLRLTPRTGSADFVYFDIALNDDGSIERFVLYDQFRQRTKVRLYNVKRNELIDPRHLEVRIPESVGIIGDFVRYAP